jgi:hypothetical protein
LDVEPLRSVGHPTRRVGSGGEPVA